MPLETRARPLTPELSLPPPFTLVRLRELGDAFAHAIAIAPAQGAGTLVDVGRFDLAEFAVVLEPDQPLAQARLRLLRRHGGADRCAHRPRRTGNRHHHRLAGFDFGQSRPGGRRPPGLAEGIREDETPPWLVFGAMIRTVSMSGAEPGLNPLVTALAEEGFSDAMSDRVVESFARHFMAAIDAWQEHGFGAVARSYLERLPPEQGLRRDIDENGDLLVRRMGKPEVERKQFLPRLAAPAWFDPAAKGPRA